MGKPIKPSPVETKDLHHAEWILENRGMDDFLDHCDANNFTANDIEAVQNKVNKVHKLSSLKKMLGKIGNKEKGTDLETELEEIPF